MTERDCAVGQNIICSDSSIGKIVEITSLSDNGEEFYKVVFPKQACVNYYSVKNNHSYRLLASKKVIDQAISIFNSLHDTIEYTSTQEKIKQQKDLLKESDICKLAKTLSIIHQEKVSHPQISKAFKESLKTFVDEIKFVTKMTSTEAYSALKMKVPSK